MAWTYVFRKLLASDEALTIRQILQERSSHFLLTKTLVFRHGAVGTSNMLEITRYQMGNCPFLNDKAKGAVARVFKQVQRVIFW